MKKSILLLMLLAGTICVSAQSKGKYQIKFLEINKQNSDLGVAILDNSKLVFTSSDEKAKTRKSYNPRKDLYIGDISSNGEIINVKPIPDSKDNKYNQTGVTYTADKKTVFFSRSLYVNKKRKQKLAKNQRLDIYRASVAANGSWSNIEKLPFNNNNFSTGFPILNEDNTKLYFVSDRLPSLGNNDIFVVNISKDGNFGKPRNLGKNVNTSGNETTPFITKDNILYFSSDGHAGKGKLDVFAVEVFESSTSEVYQLASPINSINDDFAYIINKENNLGFFTSNRLQGKDFNDLYAFTLEKDVRPGKCFISVEGKVKDLDTKEAIPGASVDLYDLKGELLESISTYNDGSYKFTVSCDSEYKVIASNDNYKPIERRIEILEENYHATLYANLNLDRIEEKKIIVETLQPIYFDFDDASIKKSASIEMDKIVSIMKDNPDLIIEASAFTDSRGTNEYNRKLSIKRAKSAVDYIVSKGIDKTRVKGKGYGEEKLRNQCVNGVNCKEHDHQMNRRTEFNFVNIQANINKRKPIGNKRHVSDVNRWSHNKTLKKSSTDKTGASSKVTGVKVKLNTDVKKQSPKVRTKDVNNNLAQSNEQKKEEKLSLSIQPDEPKVKSQTKPEVAKTNIKPKVKSQTKQEITKTNITPKAKPRKANIAENYIDEQKGEILIKLSLLEKKYENVISKKSKLLDSAIVQKKRIVDYKKAVINLDETGWSNIINYKIKLKKFKRTYQNLISENSQKRNAGPISNAQKSVKPKTKKITENTRTKSIVPTGILDKNSKIRNVHIVGIQVSHQGNYSPTSNASETELIKVSFKINKNKELVPGKMDAHIVVQNPKGEIAGAQGIFTERKSNKQKVFTDHTTIDYDDNDVNVVVYIEREDINYVKGVYPVELFLEGELVAVSNLNLAGL